MVGNLTPEHGVPVVFQHSWDRVQVDHHLDDVAGAFLAGLGVNDGGFIFPMGNDVRSPGQRGGPAAELRSVLDFAVDAEAADFPVSDALVEERGVVERPPGLAETRWLLGPVLVVRLEPHAPLAGVLAHQ